MREIKFKLWDTVEKKWRDEPFGVLGNGTIVGYAFIVLHESRYKLVQFTGLKDKSGKEIFEGDVVRDDYGNRDKVIWSQGDLGFELEEIITSDVGSAQIWVGLTIIGNIYENPELVEEEK